jgi:sulfide dehydrogenase cytochrome subunit
MKNSLLVAGIVAGLTFANASLASDKTKALANTCNACHGLNGVSVGPSMPSIGGLSEAYLKAVMTQWKKGDRYSATMGRHFTGYTEDELAALATYFSKLPWVPVVQPASADVLAKGKEATERCETCHGATGSEPDDEMTPRLNGQWAQYMELELMKYRTETIKMPHRKMRGNAKKLAEDAVPASAQFYAAQPK